MRKTPCFYLALWAGKFTAFALRLMHRSATHLPGWIAVRICPDFLGRIGKPETIIAVTGTNGKTTVCNLLNDILPDCGVMPLNNRAGGNIREGIACALLDAATIGGRVRDKVAVLEVDERTTPYIFPYIVPDYLVVTNLFRDSMRRNAHVEFITDILNGSIPKTTKLIVNADDLISSHLAPDNERVSFGIARRDGDGDTVENIVCDAVACPHCNTTLHYDFVRYNHIGRAQCPSCGYGSLTPDFELTAADTAARTLTFTTPDGEETYHMIGDNITDWYNTLAVVTLLRTFGFDAAAIGASLQKQQIVKSRFDHYEKDGKEITMMLSKGQNPIACSRSFDYIRRSSKKNAVILLVEDVFDAKYSSENIAWLYDADFEFLNNDNTMQVIVAGVRAADFRVRLLIAGVPDERIILLPDDSTIHEVIDVDVVDSVFVLFDVITVAYPDKVRDRLKERLGIENEEVPT